MSNFKTLLQRFNLLLVSKVLVYLKLVSFDFSLLKV